MWLSRMTWHSCRCRGCGGGPVVRPLATPPGVRSGPFVVGPDFAGPEFAGPGGALPGATGPVGAGPALAGPARAFPGAAVPHPAGPGLALRLQVGHRRGVEGLTHDVDLTGQGDP